MYKLINGFLADADLDDDDQQDGKENEERFQDPDFFQLRHKPSEDLVRDKSNHSHQETKSDQDP